MDPLYTLRPPVAPPPPPRRWSFTSLAAWRSCPRRWWLERARFDNAPTPYPQRVGPQAVEGRLVHEALEQFAQHVAIAKAQDGARSYADVRAAFPVRAFMREKLRQMCESGLARNPRVRVPQILARISIDECVDAFRRAAGTVWEATRAGTPVQKSDEGAAVGAIDGTHVRASESPSVRAGAEVWLEVDDPPLAGRLDYVATRTITDFKTGAMKDTHWEQLRFYALLYWLATGRIVERLRLVYTSTAQVLEAAGHGLADLEELRYALREEIGAISQVLDRGSPPEARPAADRCGMCGVRQLCDEYWISRETRSLRAVAKNGLIEEPVVGWYDVAASLLAPNCGAPSSYTASAMSPDLGVVTLRLDSAHTPLRLERNCRVRALGARVSITVNALEVSIGEQTEAFWLID